MAVLVGKSLAGPLTLRKPGSGKHGLRSSAIAMSPKTGQPYRLYLLQALAKSWGDPNMALLPFLQHGVPTGAVSALPPSLQWPAKKPDTAVPPDLEICEGNWKMAEDEPKPVTQ